MLIIFVNNNLEKILSGIQAIKEYISKKHKISFILKFICSVFIIYFFLLYLNQFIWGIDLPIISTGLDPSYKLILSRISNVQSFFWGGDITFTYGPYGFLLFGERYILSFLFGIVLLLLNVALFLLNYYKKYISFGKLLFFSLILFVFVKIELLQLPMPVLEWQFNITLFFFFCTFWKIKDHKILFYLFSILAGLLCSFALLLKFNTAVLSIGLAGVFSLFILLFHKDKILKFIFIFVGVYLLFLLCNIPYYFNNLNNFFTWIIMSIELARGYSQSMVLIGGRIYLLFALMLIALYIIIFILYKQIKTIKDDYFIILLGTVILFFSFKHGFVRPDILHMFLFYYTVPFLFGFIYLFSKEKYSNKILALLILSGLISFIGITNLTSIYIFSGNPINPIKKTYRSIKYFDERTKSLDERKKTALQPSFISSEWNEIIGNNTIQVLPWELTYAIANNWKGWMPNPVLQLYAVYTKRLDKYSALSFSEERAPQYILLEYNAIDYRNMFLDTPQTWNAIVHNYRILKSDYTRLLLEKQNIHSTPKLVHFDSGAYRFNEEITIPSSPSGTHVYAKISIKQSFVGRIITTFFRGESPSIKLHFQDAGAEIYSIIPETLNSPVLIDTIPTNFAQMEYFFNGIICDDFFIKKITFLNNSPFMFKKEIKIDWYYSNYSVNRNRKIIENEAIAVLPISKDINVLKQNTYDIISVEIINGNIVLTCGTVYPYLWILLEDAINKPSGIPYIEIMFTNSKAGFLDTYYSYGSGFRLENNSFRHIGINLEEATIRLPVVGWNEGERLVGFRIKPPSGSVFTIKQVKLVYRR